MFDWLFGDIPNQDRVRSDYATKQQLYDNIMSLRPAFKILAEEIATLKARVAELEDKSIKVL